MNSKDDSAAEERRSVRELGGEIGSELLVLGLAPPDLQRILDIAMGVLARYDGWKIYIDDDFPVAPLPDRFPCSWRRNY